MSWRALIAEDEPILAAVLARSLARLWPELEIAAVAPNGLAAVEDALALRPDVLFLDIKMPGMSGLDAAAALLARWDGARPFPQLVFVTAFDDFAVQAFEQAALDYVLKPVSEPRLARTVERVRARLAAKALDGNMACLAQIVDLLQDQIRAQLREGMRALLPAPPAPARLQVIRAAVGDMVRMIPVREVLYFQAVDKYVNVATAEGDALIRLSLKDLLSQLDGERFRQVNRGCIVNLAGVSGASRDAAGKLTLALRGRPDKLRVSPLFSHLFRQM